MTTDRELREQLALDLFIAFHCDGTNFNAQLFRLMHKADPGNLTLISLGFSTHVAIYREWRESPEERSFFRRYLLSKRLRGEREQAILEDMVRAPHLRRGVDGEGQGTDGVTGENGW
jgi:hypothetical protein